MLWIGVISILMWWLFPVAFRAIMGTDGIDLYQIQVSHPHDMKIFGVILLLVMLAVLFAPLRIVVVRGGLLNVRVYLKRREHTWPREK